MMRVRIFLKKLYNIIHFNQGCLTWTWTSPSLRLPPLQEQPLLKLLKDALPQQGDQGLPLQGLHQGQLPHASAWTPPLSSRLRVLSPPVQVHQESLRYFPIIFDVILESGSNLHNIFSLCFLFPTSISRRLSLEV